MRHAARTDENQAEIVKALRRIGVSVYYVKLPLDLLVCHRGITALVECKMPGESLNKNQVAFIEKWPGKVFIVHGPTEAVSAITRMTA